MKQKYWYKTTIYACVLYDENEKGVEWHDDACHSHF